MIARYKRPNPKRAKPRAFHSERTAHLNGGHKRERLKTRAEKESRRMELFERSHGRCEAEKKATERYPTCANSQKEIILRCNAPITWNSMHWSHKRHSANKCDCLDCGIASCAECHLVGRHNPKPITVRKRDICQAS